MKIADQLTMKFQAEDVFLGQLFRGAALSERRLLFAFLLVVTPVGSAWAGVRESEL